ncbi:MAG: hypothetical protein M3O91_02450 [Chloroflexota bacterium]|nr:hypothetical protein [Chloroflexota bacterium]
MMRAHASNRRRSGSLSAIYARRNARSQISVETRSRRIGWFALLIAGSGAALVAIRMTRAFDIYCDWSNSCLGLLAAALPAYVAMLGMTLPGLLIASSLSDSAASPYLKASALSCGILAFSAYLLMTASAYDALWANYGSSAGLDAPRLTPFLPSVVLATTSVLWPLFFGATIVLTSLVFDAVRLPRAVLALGLAAGLTLMASETLALDVVTSLYVGFGLVTLWAAAVATQLLPARRRSLSAT